MTQSEALEFFESKTLADFRKAKDSELKLQVAIGERLNSVIRACGSIVKAVSALGNVRRR